MCLDQLNGLLVHDLQSIKRFERCRPHLYALDVNHPQQLSSFMRQPPQIIANIANWVNSDELRNTP